MEIIGVIELSTFHALTKKIFFILLVFYMVSVCSTLFAQTKALQDHNSKLAVLVSEKQRWCS